MGNFFKICAVGLTAAIGITSCIQEEALNTECDILTCTVPESILESPVVVDNNTVTLRIRPTGDISQLAPEFTVTEGATITPASGTPQDFLNAENHTVYYTVTSQDGEWSKKYPVRVIQKEIPSVYKFNGTRLNLGEGDKGDKYSILVERDENGEEVMTWASGNPGFVMSGVADRNAQKDYGYPDDPLTYKQHIWKYFPTRAVYAEGVIQKKNPEDGYTYFYNPDGTYAKPEFIRLTTCSTGSFGSMVGMPIAAGNMFQGFFDLGQAIGNPLGATKFGEPYHYVPVKLQGRYRYKAGPVFKNKAGQVLDRKDIFSIYALFFESEPGKVDYIDGTIHIDNFQHDNLVSVALMKDARESDEWVTFEIPFEAAVNGSQLDREKLGQGLYKIGIVISSSIDGDTFQGAVGSTLDIADLRIINEYDK